MDDKSWAVYDDPTWAHRPTLIERQLKSALELTYHISALKLRRTESMPYLVTRAIAAMVPSDEVSNRKLLFVLFGLPEKTSGGLETKMARNFRNEERTLKLNTAASYVQRLTYSKIIPPGEGGRLWYFALLYSSAMAVTNRYLNCGMDVSSFQRDQVPLISAACGQFDFLLRTSIRKSSELPLIGYPLNDVKQFMDYCTFVHWQESRVKRNPLASIKRIIDLTPRFNEYEFT